MKLNARQVDTAKYGTEKGHKNKIFDGKGLFLELHKNGGKYWRYKYRYLGKEKLYSLDASGGQRTPQGGP